MHDRQATRDGAGNFGHIDFNAARVTTVFAEQMLDQRAVAAANVQHTRSRVYHFGYESQIYAHVPGAPKEEGKDFFFAKKKQKTFVYLALCIPPAIGFV
jgi:hypothetical protein